MSALFPPMPHCATMGTVLVATASDDELDFLAEDEDDDDELLEDGTGASDGAVSTFSDGVAGKGAGTASSELFVPSRHAHAAALH